MDLLRLCLAPFILIVVTATAVPTAAQDEYTLTADSKRQAGVPQGKVTEHEWNSSKIYPGTTRKYWVYVPSQYDGSTPACVMVFQDGFKYVDDLGARVPIVFDNLIHKKEMPLTVGVFINPGVFDGSTDQKKRKQQPQLRVRLAQ